MDKFDDLITELSESPALNPVRTTPAQLCLKWLSIALIYIAIALAISGLRPQLSMALNDIWFVSELILLFGLLISTALSAAVLVFPDLYQKRAWAYFPAYMLAAFSLFLIAAAVFAPSAPPPLHNIECCLSIFGLAILPALGIFHAMQQLASTHPRASSSVAGIFAFSCGAIWLRLYENTDSYTHLILWHYLPMLLVVAAGMLLGRKLLRW